jgi:hypothetical protein
MELKYVLFFLIGGTVITSVTFLASHSRSVLAAFFANLPVMTLLTFLMIYYETGQNAVVPYAKGLVIMLFPWLTYIFSVILLTPRVGFFPSLAAGFSLYLAVSFVILRRFS